MNNAVFGKTMESMEKPRDIKLVTTERRRNYLVSEPNYHAKKFFIENLLAIEMKKLEKLTTKPVKNINIWVLVWLYKIKIWWKSKIMLYGYIKTHDIFKDIAEDVETRFDTSTYELDRPFPKGKK